MAELGMKLAEATAQKALSDKARAAADPAAKPARNMALTFARIANTVHQAIKLEAKLTAPPAQRAPRRPAAPKTPRERPAPPPAETYPEPPATEWPFLKHYAQPRDAEPPPAENPQTPPAPKAPAPTPVFDGKNTWLRSAPKGPAPAAAAPPPTRPPEPAWTKPPQPRATDPPRPTGPNWARLFER